MQLEDFWVLTEKNIVFNLETINHQLFNENLLNVRSNSLGMLVNFVAITTTFSNGKPILVVDKGIMRSAFNVVSMINNFQIKFLILTDY